jgi:hypothetical protein
MRLFPRALGGSFTGSIVGAGDTGRTFSQRREHRGPGVTRCNPLSDKLHQIELWRGRYSCRLDDRAHRTGPRRRNWDPWNSYLGGLTCAGRQRRLRRRRHPESEYQRRDLSARPAVRYSGGSLSAKLLQSANRSEGRIHRKLLFLAQSRGSRSVRPGSAAAARQGESPTGSRPPVIRSNTGENRFLAAKSICRVADYRYLSIIQY